MSNRKSGHWTRRHFVRTASLASAGSLWGLRSESIAADPALETTTLRIVQAPGYCFAPQYVAEDLLRAEGFSDVQYVRTASGEPANSDVISGRADMTMHFSAPNIIRVEKNDPIVILAGVHVGCFEVFGSNRVRAILDLKGKTVAVPAQEGPQQVFVATIAAYVGIDPRKDIKWVVHPFPETMRLLDEGKIDAYLGFPPQPLELRAKKIGHVVLNSMTDRPWSQYFCCMLIANREFVGRHPIATKRALRAILKGADVCAREPERVARFLVDKSYAQSYDHSVATLKDIPYKRWREYDPEDTVRFYSLRLQEAGMIKSTPQRIIARGTDWRFIRELKRELKT